MHTDLAVEAFLKQRKLNISFFHKYMEIIVKKRIASRIAYLYCRWLIIYIIFYYYILILAVVHNTIMTQIQNFSHRFKFIYVKSKLSCEQSPVSSRLLVYPLYWKSNEHTWFNFPHQTYLCSMSISVVFILFCLVQLLFLLPFRSRKDEAGHRYTPDFDIHIFSFELTCQRIKRMAQRQDLTLHASK